MSAFSQLIAKSQECLGLDPEELQKLLDFIVCSKVTISEQVRVLAMAVGNTLLGSTLNLAKRFPLHIAIQHGRSELIPLLLQVYGTFIHAKCDGCTASHLAAYRMELASLVHLYRHDPTVLYDVDDYGLTPFRILYLEFLRVNFPRGQFNKEYPAHVYAYGENPVSNLGIASGHRAAYPTIVELPREYTEVHQVSLGRFHSLFLVNGKVFVCGLGRDSRLGLGDESDFALPHLIDIPEKAVCVAAGLSHSVVCSAKKIFVFGSNIKGQLGFPKKDVIAVPTMAFRLKNTDDNFVRCVACESYSAAFTEQGRWYISGSNLPWHSDNITQFVYCPELHHRDALMSDIAIVFGAWKCSTKVSVCTHGSLIDSHIFQCETPCEKCLGVFEHFGVRVLVQCAFRPSRGKLETGPSTYALLSDHPAAPIPEKLQVEFLDTKGSLPMKVHRATVARTGEIVVVDEAGLVFEGNLCDALRTYTSGSPQEGVLPVLLDRICGLPPVREVYISSDGKNKALLVCDLQVSLFSWGQQRILPKVAGPVKSVKAICVKEDMSEIASFNTCRNYLMKESDYCSTFFTRWSTAAPKAKLFIRFVASSFAVDQFVLFCATHQISSGLTSSQLFELLLFADAYCCDNFFNHIVDQFLTDQFDILTLRDLYSIARYTKRPRLFEIVNGLCAAFFPILLDRGFVNDLTDDEVRAIETCCKTDDCFRYQPSQVDEKLISSHTEEKLMLDSILKLAGIQRDNWIKTDYFLAERRQLRAGEANEKVDTWLESLSTDLEAGGNDYVEELYNYLQKRFAKARPIITTRRTRRRSEQEEASEAHAISTTSVFQRPSTSKGLSKPALREIRERYSSTSSEAASPPKTPVTEALVEQVADRMLEIMSPLSDISTPNRAKVFNGRIHCATASSSCQNGILAAGIQDGALNANSPSDFARVRTQSGVSDVEIQSSSSSHPLPPSSPRKISSRENNQALVSSPSSSASVGSPRKFSGWNINGEKSTHDQSFRDILEKEFAASQKKQQSPGTRVSWKKPTITHRYDMNLNICAASPPSVKAAWNVATTDEEKLSSSFRDIVEDEVAKQSETKRVTTTQVADIETEEHAISELVAVYEADAARNGSAATISVERIQAARSNPLWSARS